MRRIPIVLLLAFAACTGDPPDEAPDAGDLAAAAPSPTAAAAGDFAAGEVILKTTARVTAGEPIELGGRLLVPLREIGPATWLMQLAGDPDGAAADAADAAADLAAQTLVAIDTVRLDPAVEFAHSNLQMELSLEPSDPLYGEQWWQYNVIGLPAAWGITTGPTQPGVVRLAIIDTGSTAHDDLVWAQGRDFSANPDDDDPTNPFTYHHGTMVAGIAAARANNGEGGVGVCWGCDVMALRANASASSIDLAAAIQALYWAAGQDVGGVRRAEAANLSFNNPAATCAANQAMRDAVEYAIGRGVVVVVSAGNHELATGPEFPADCPGALAVAALAPSYALSEFTSHGPGIDLVAPGGGWIDGVEGQFHGTDVPPGSCPIVGNETYAGTGGIVSSWSVPRSGPQLGPNDHCYRQSSGTSFSAPHVTGTVGLMRTVRPALTPLQIEWVLRLTAEPPSPFIGWGWVCPLEDPADCGPGLLRADAAVDAIDTGNPPIATATPSRHDFGALPGGGNATTTIVLGNVGFSTMNVTSSQPMEIIGGGGWISFAYASGLCTTGQTCARSFGVLVNGTANIPLRCTAGSSGTQIATLRIPSNTVSGRVEVPLRCASSGGPVISVSPTTLDFGDVLVGTTATRQLTVTNTGVAPLTITAGTTSAPFARTTALPITVPANGGTTQLTITCTPTATTTYNSALGIGSNGGNPSVPLACRGVAPVLAVSPASLPFGDVLVGTTATQQLTVTNTGTAPLTITAASTSAPFARTTALPITLAANGGTAQLTVTCTPTAMVTYNNTLAITSNGGNPSVPLSCRGVAPVLAVSPPSLQFGDVLVGATASLQLTLSNTGTAPLTITAASTSAPFARNASLPITLAANGGTTQITVTCAPTAMVTYNSALAITSNGGNPAVPLSCRGVAPLLSVTPTSLAFGDVLVGTTATQIVNVANVGTATLTVTSVTTAAPFSRTTPPLPFTVAATSSTMITASCTPTTTGVVTGALTITSNGGAATVPLSCRGVAPALWVAPQSLEFADVLVGSSKSLTIGIANTGTAPLSISAANAFAPFSRTSPLPGPIAPGTTHWMTIACAPTSAAYFIGELSIATDGGAAVVPLWCRGANGLIELVQPAGGELVITPYAPGQVVIRNVGVGPMTVADLGFSGDLDDAFGFADVELPAVIEVGETLSWTVTCSPTWLAGTYWTKHYVKHDGVWTGSLLALGCDNGPFWDVPVDPVPVDPIPIPIDPQPIPVDQ